MDNMVIRDDAIAYFDKFEENSGKVVKKLDEVEGVILNSGEQVIAALEELDKTNSNEILYLNEIGCNIDKVADICKVATCHAETCAFGLNSLIKAVKGLEKAVWIVGGALIVIGALNIVIP